MSPPRESGSGFDALAFDGAVDRRAADAEELGDFEGAVLATVYQRDQVRLLATVELGLFAAQPTLGLGDLYAFAGTKPDQVGLELSHHREHVEQQPTDSVGGVVARPTKREAGLPRGEFVGDRSGVGRGSGQAVELGDHQRVPARQAASASRSPGRSRLVPVRPWST